MAGVSMGDAADVEDSREATPWSCPLPESHDRFIEAHYFLHRLEEEYHDPQLFRFHLNAFISALRAVHELLQKELERAGQVGWWKERRVEFTNDPVLAKFARGRNVTLHQRSILKGSRVDVGLFRGRKMKLVTRANLQSDEPSAALLERMVPLHVGFILDEEHAALDEQIGVQRLYFVAELSEDEDVIRASRRALARTSRAIAEAHNRLGADHIPATDDDVLDEGQLGHITVLLESDVDPEAPIRWGWVEDPAEDPASASGHAVPDQGQGP